VLDILTIVEWYRALTAAAVILLLLGWESLTPAFAFFKERAAARIRHGLVNVILFVVNVLIVRFAFVALWLATAEWTIWHGFGIANWLGLADSVWHTVVVILLFDLWTYWWHRANHKIRFFWRFHRVHHSDIEMDVTTANRFHFGELLFSSVLRIPLIALFGAAIWEVAVYELVLFPVVQFHHANVALPGRLDRALRTVIVTPDMHKVHHSEIRRETDSNYTSMFSFWDRLFRSFLIRETTRDVDFGVAAPPEEDTQSLSTLLASPFRYRRDL
jgi:sterol desaturase/sphingolipid hydroxylase (fatty acid hydroxylase superfamily)